MVLEELVDEKLDILDLFCSHLAVDIRDGKASLNKSDRLCDGLGACFPLRLLFDQHFGEVDLQIGPLQQGVTLLNLFFAYLIVLDSL